MILNHCTCEETQAALGDSLPCSFCWSGGAEDPNCVACPHCSLLQIPHKPTNSCAGCQKPLAANMPAPESTQMAAPDEL